MQIGGDDLSMRVSVFFDRKLRIHVTVSIVLPQASDTLAK